MLFMGSETFPDENYFEELVIEGGNGHTNAYTTDELTGIRCAYPLAII